MRVLDGMLLLHFHTQKREKEKNVKTQSSLVGGGEKSLCRQLKRLLKISEQKKKKRNSTFQPNLFTVVVLMYSNEKT